MVYLRISVIFKIAFLLMSESDGQRASSTTSGFRSADDDLEDETAQITVDDEGDSEGVEEEITAQQVLACLESAWTNEMCAPEILPHQSDMIELMMGQVEHMEGNMRNLDKNDFRYVVHQMEIERIRYIIVSYLRCRLQKIEHFTKWILEAEENRVEEEKYLSPEETRFAEGYYDCVEKHFEQMALQYMPTMQRADAAQRIVRPNLMSHVFVKANTSCKCLLLISYNTLLMFPFL